MLRAISNTSPLLYLSRIDGLKWLPALFSEVWVPSAVLAELDEGRNRGYNVPAAFDYEWLQIVNPDHLPSEWFALDLGLGEIAAMALALENPDRVVLLDDRLARRTARAAGLTTWGTLRILLEAKTAGFVPEVGPHIDRLQASGMWISTDSVE